MIEPYEKDLNKHLDLQEQQELSYLQFEAEVYDGVKTLNELAYYIEKLQDKYESDLASLVDIARKYGSHEYDFTEDLMSLIKQL